MILDGGLKYVRNPENPGAKPTEYAKHVVMRTDRSDGFVGRNFTMRGALEHGFYTEETDGILLDKVKFFWAADYGHLSFTTDHNVIQNCDGFGSGDAAVYPGASPQTGDFRDESFYPKQRFNTVVRRCDLHGSTLAYSGSMGNSVRMTKNNIYGNTNGISSDTLSAPGHPGFPADGMQVDKNYIYSNNLNLYTDNPPVKPLVPMPIGTGIVWPGMNGGKVKDNWIFDNWRHGTVLAAVPDALIGEPEGNVDRAIHCTLVTNLVASTSCGNEYCGQPHGPGAPGLQAAPLAHEVRQQDRADGRDGRRLAAEWRRLLVGRVPRQQRQLLARQHRLGWHRCQRDGSRSGRSRPHAAAPVRLREQRGPGRRGEGSRPARLLDVVPWQHRRRSPALLLVPDAGAARDRGRRFPRPAVGQDGEVVCRQPGLRLAA